MLLRDRLLIYLPAAVPALAYAVLRCDIPLQIGLLVPVIFLLDSLHRSRPAYTVPARAIGADKRKVRRLNDAQTAPLIVQDEVRLAFTVM